MEGKTYSDLRPKPDPDSGELNNTDSESEYLLSGILKDTDTTQYPCYATIDNFIPSMFITAT